MILLESESDQGHLVEKILWVKKRKTYIELFKTKYCLAHLLKVKSMDCKILIRT